MDSCRFPKTPIPMMRKMAVESKEKLKKNVKIQDQDCNLSNSILKLPKIKGCFKPTPIPTPKQYGRENCGATDSGFLLALEDGIDDQTCIDRGVIRRTHHLKEGHKAALFKLQEKKPRPINVNARDVQNQRDKQEELKSKTLLQTDRHGQKPLPAYLLVAISNEVSGKDKHSKQFKQSLSCKKEQKPNKQVAEKAEEQRQQHQRVSEGKRYVHDEREKNVDEKVKFHEKCKKMAYDNLENIRRQEYIKDALEEKKINKEMAKQEFAQKLLDKQEKEKKVKMQKYLTDAWDGQVEYKRHKKMEMDKIADKDRSREIRKKIVYDQLSLIKKEDDKKRAFMEDHQLKEKKQRESAEQKRENLEKEKKAAAIKSLTNSWDSQIQRKRQEKKELCDIERKDMRSLMEMERVCEGENIISHQTLPGTSKNCAKRSVCSADKHDDTKTRPLLSRQKVSNTKPVTLPSVKSTTVHFTEDCQQHSKRNAGVALRDDRWRDRKNHICV